LEVKAMREFKERKEVLPQVDIHIEPTTLAKANVKWYLEN